MGDGHLRGFFRRTGPALLLALGAAAMSAGIGLIFMPAGLIAGGVMALTAGIAMIMGGEDDG